MIPEYPVKSASQAFYELKINPFKNKDAISELKEIYENIFYVKKCKGIDIKFG